MAKLVLKDGRLQKVEDKKDVIDNMEVPLPPPKQVPNFEKELPTFEDEQGQQQFKLREQMIQQQLNDEIKQEQQRRLYEQQLFLERQQAQQQYTQPQQQRYVPPQPNLINIVIVMSVGEAYRVEVVETQVEQFLAGLDNAINTQTVFSLNNRVINGKNVVSYVIE